MQLEDAISSRLSNQRDYYQFEMEKLDNQINLINLQIGKCRLVAPVTGTILTQQLELKIGKTVSRGEQICEIADLNRWQLIMEVPQQEIGWVLRALEELDSTSVVFILEIFPQYKLQGEITGPDQISEMPQTTQEGNVYEIRVDVTDEQISQGEIKLALRDGSVGRAEIATLKRPLGYVLLRKVIRFFRLTFF